MSYLYQETGDKILLESGDAYLLEQEIKEVLPPDPNAVSGWDALGLRRRFLGAVDVVTVAGPTEYPYTATGGAELSSSAGVIAEFIQSGSGGVELAGSAGVGIVSSVTGSGGGTLSTVAQAFFDNFNRADLGDDWTAASGSPSIVDNSVFSGAGVFNFAVYNKLLASSDQYAEVLVASVGSGSYFLLGLRLSGPPWNAHTGYEIYFSDTLLQIRCITDGMATSIFQSLNPGLSPADRIRFTALGNTFYVTQNGRIVAETTDTTYPDGQYLGLTVGRSAAPTFQIDEWSAGQFGISATSTSHSFSSSGELAGDGSAGVGLDVIPSASGGLEAAGEATVGFSSVGYAVTGSGGVEFASSASVAVDVVEFGSGGASTGGAATASYVSAVGPVFVNATGKTGQTATPSVALDALNCVTGNSLYVFISNFTDSGRKAVTGISDTAGNDAKFALVGTRFSGEGTYHYQECWVADNITGNASNVLTVTFTDTATFVHIAVLQYSNTANPSYDAEGIGKITDLSLTQTSNTVTTTVAKDLVLGYFVGWSGAFTASSCSPSIERTDLASVAVAELVAGDAGSYDCEITASEAVTCASTVYAFKAYVPAITQTYEETGSGGAEVAGAAGVGQQYGVLGSGGLEGTGAGVFASQYGFLASGEGTLAGNAVESVQPTTQGSGGLEGSGTAGVVLNVVFLAAGELTAAGAATVSASYAGYVVTGSGGVTLSGTSTGAVDLLEAGSGGIALAGTATTSLSIVTLPPSANAVSGWDVLWTRRRFLGAVEGVLAQAQEYPYTAVGGVELAGVGVSEAQYVGAVSGELSAGGSGVSTQTYIGQSQSLSNIEASLYSTGSAEVAFSVGKQSSGGSELGGSGIAVGSYVGSASGGTDATGSGAITVEFVFAGFGGGDLSGAATTSVTSAGYTHTASGGVELAGLASVAIVFVPTVQGGIEGAGSGTSATSQTTAGSGGIEAAGSGASETVSVVVGDGGVSSAGNAGIVLEVVPASSGGVEASGLATVVFEPIAPEYSHTASGGIELSGEASVSVVFVPAIQGGIALSTTTELFRDTFERTSPLGIGDNWQVVTGSPAIYDNSDLGGAAPYNVMGYLSPLPTPDQYAEVVISSTGGVGDYLILRLQMSEPPTNWASPDGYEAYYAGNLAQIRCVTADMGNAIGQTLSPPFASGDRIRFERIGNTFRISRNSIPIVEVTDSTYAGGQYLGIILGGSTTPTLRIEDWSAGQFGISATSTSHSFPTSGGIEAGGSATTSLTTTYPAYSVVGSGGAELAGASCGNVVFVGAVSGGVEAAGAATTSATGGVLVYPYTASGGAELSGIANSESTYVGTAQGGSESAGAATNAFIAIIAGSDGCALSGIAGIGFHGLIVGSGSVVLSGAGVWSATWTGQASGGVDVAGEASSGLSSSYTITGGIQFAGEAGLALLISRYGTTEVEIEGAATVKFLERDYLRSIYPAPVEMSATELFIAEGSLDQDSYCIGTASVVGYFGAETEVINDLN